MATVDDIMWVAKYRPRRVADCILPERVSKDFEAMVANGKLANMTLIGSPGTGKTTIARALCEEMGIDYLIINASEERNIETIRTTVRQYGSTVSLVSPIKCIILDEADSLTPEAQKALRFVIEEFIGICRFILTGNFGNKILEALTSRCPVIDFNVLKEEKTAVVMRFAKRLGEILEENGIEYDRKDLLTVVLKNFPDFRKTIGVLQRYTALGRLDVTATFNLTDESVETLVAYLKSKDFAKMRKWVVEHMDNDGSVIRRSLYDRAFDHVSPSSIPEMVLLLAQYDYKEGFCADREINTVAMLIELMATLEFK